MSWAVGVVAVVLPSTDCINVIVPTFESSRVAFLHIDKKRAIWITYRRGSLGNRARVDAVGGESYGEARRSTCSLTALFP